MTLRILTCYQTLKARGQGLEVRRQGQGLVNWSSMTGSSTTTLEFSLSTPSER